MLRAPEQPAILVPACASLRRAASGLALADRRNSVCTAQICNAAMHNWRFTGAWKGIAWRYRVSSRSPPPDLGDQGRHLFLPNAVVQIEPAAPPPAAGFFVVRAALQARELVAEVGHLLVFATVGSRLASGRSAECLRPQGVLSRASRMTGQGASNRKSATVRPDTRLRI